MQVHRIVVCLAASAAVVTLAACGGSSDTATTTTPRDISTMTQTETVTAPPSAPHVTSTTNPAVPATSATTALMPNVVCMNLQAAQDKIQAAGVFYSRSKDATGQGRAQVLDRNWIVVAQTPEPGAHFGEGEAILSAVKIGETSTC